MIALPSFLATFDKPQAKSVSGEAETLESAENAGNDGFAALIAQLIQIVPAAIGQDAEGSLSADGESGNPASGKILPVDSHNLAAATAGPAASQTLPGTSPVPVSAALMSSSATIISFQQAQTAQAAKQGEPIAQGATDADVPQAPAKEGPVSQSTPRADQIRMTVSVAPAETAALRTAAPQDASPPVEKRLTQALASQFGEPKQSGRDPQTHTPAMAERFQSGRAAAPEKEFGAGERPVPAPTVETGSAAARAMTSGDTGKSAAMPVAAAPELAAPNRGDAMRMAAAAPTNAMTSVEGIERLVERLSVAREFDMTKSASISVTHREFGALTVTFDNARNGLDVEIAAKDNDMQRALAQAVAADRPTSRTGEPFHQSLQQNSQAASAGSERGPGSTGQGATSSGAGSEGERSPNQRDRNLPSPPQDPRNAARPSPGDDALYA